MTSTWQLRLNDAGAQLSGGLTAGIRFLSRPSVFPRFRRGIFVLLGVWIVVSLWRAGWSFLPETPPLPAVTVINPVQDSAGPSATVAIDIEGLVAARLFGEPGTPLSPADSATPGGRSPAMSEEEASVALAGIEDGAPETRLPLLLRGVVAASEAGLGQAVIEHRKNQDLYQVSDELPVNGRVILAKVLPTLVVLDNGGRYEVLRLFEESPLSRQADQVRSTGVASAVTDNSRRQSAVAATEPARRDVSTGQGAAQVAARYRDQLYQNPESLAEVVRIAAVRDDGDLLGYRISPGRAAQEFTALGFESGDIVTAVNGLSLSDPANTVRLYQAMRSAQSASFALERNGEQVVVDVDLSGSGN